MRKKTKKFVFIMLIILILAIFGTLHFFKGYFEKKKVDDTPIVEKKEKVYSSTFTFAGSVLINSNMWSDTRTNEGYNFDTIFESANDIMKKSNVNFYFQSSMLGGTDLGTSRVYNYNSPSELVKTLTKVGFNMASVASYHSYDKGMPGITNTIKTLNENKIIFSGINDSENKNNSNVVTKNGMKIGLLSYTVGTDEVISESDKYAINIYSEEKAKTDIEELKNNVDLIIVSIDWNNTNTSEITENQKAIATKLSELGANIIVGNNNFSIQPIEKINNTLVCYSLGNLLSGHAAIDSRISAMVDFEVKISKKKVEINDINVGLYYAYNVNGSNYKIIPFAKMAGELTNYKTYYEKYKELLTKDNDNIKFYSIGD